ncbi:MAG: plasmid partition protein ParG [Planctomycetia bacterium]|jgi:hypothetical protein|nr:plasmid partition protein ParG [Planctomycetia bacterium]
MTKKVMIGARPTSKTPQEADTWVENRIVDDERKMKRLTIDIPESLHRRIKTQCATRGTKIADEVRELLIQKYGNQ